MHRRDVLRALAASAGMGWLECLDVGQLLALGERLHAAARAAGGRPGAGPSAHLLSTIAAAAERIIPASDTPGASDANVAPFIERMLAEWYDPADRDRLLAGLAELDERGRARHSRDFIALPERDQVALLEVLDAEAAALRDLPAAERREPEHWFSTLKFLVVWGYCTSEVAMRRTLDAWPLAGRYESCALYASDRSPGSS